MATSKKIIEHVVKTALAAELDISTRVPVQFDVKNNTTLNYKYQNYHDIVPAKFPLIQFFGLGIRGFKNIDDGFLAAPYIPENRENDLYYPIPLRCVKIDEDLSSADRALYRMRVRKDINGVPHYCYYLKKMTVLDTKVQVTQTNPLTGAQEPYTYSAADLTPTPNASTTSGEQSSTASKVNVGIHIGLEYFGWEVLEAVNAMFDGDMRYAKISEIGIYSGHDMEVAGTDASNVEIRYMESIYTQLNYKITNIGSAVTSEGYVGGREFLLGNGDLLLLS
jgi:hypothetical protein